jgi:putative inorganic carbon (HCO3(-)) transporter
VQLALMLNGPLGERWLAGVCLILSCVGIMLAASRGALIGVAVAAILMLGWRNMRRFAVIVVPLFAVLILGAVNPAPSVLDTRQLMQRISQLPGDSSTDPRLFYWEQTPKMIADHPIFGVGALEFSEYAPRYGIPVTAGVPTHAHDTLLTITAELGIVGAAAFIALCLTVAGALRRSIRWGSSDNAALGWGVAGGLTSFFAAGVVDYVLAARVIDETVFVLVGCAVGLALLAARRPAASARSVQSTRLDDRYSRPEPLRVREELAALR